MGAVVVITAILGIFSSCQSSHHKEKGLAAGQPAEIMVVTHDQSMEALEKNIHTLDFQDTILIDGDDPGKKKYENLYNYLFMNHKTFNDDQTRFAPLMLVVNMGKGAGGYDEELQGLQASHKIGKNIGIFDNVWATKQKVVHIECQNETELKQLLVQYKKELNEVFYKAELSIGMTGFLAPNKYSDSLNKLVYGGFGFRLDIAPLFTLVQANKELIWFNQETPAFYRHMLVNIFNDSIAINTQEEAIENRDYFTKKYIKNKEKTDILVSKSKLYPISWQKNVKLGNNSFDILRGWYTEEGLYRRGVFARYFYKDAANKRYVVLDGFIFAPNMRKNTLYRLFDMTAASMKFN